MALKGFLMLVAADTKRDEKFVDSVMALLAQPGEFNTCMLVCG